MRYPHVRCGQQCDGGTVGLQFRHGCRHRVVDRLAQRMQVIESLCRASERKPSSSSETTRGCDRRASVTTAAANGSRTGLINASPVLLPALRMVDSLCHGTVKLFGNACGAVDVSGPGGERWWLTASFKPLRR